MLSPPPGPRKFSHGHCEPNSHIITAPTAAALIAVVTVVGGYSTAAVGPEWHAHTPGESALPVGLPPAAPPPQPCVPTALTP